MGPASHFQQMDNTCHYRGNPPTRHLCGQIGEWQSLQKKQGASQTKAPTGGGDDNTATDKTATDKDTGSNQATHGGASRADDGHGAPAARTPKAGKIPPVKGGNSQVGSDTTSAMFLLPLEERPQYRK